jgi:hypothetical protein
MRRAGKERLSASQRRHDFIVVINEFIAYGYEIITTLPKLCPGEATLLRQPASQLPAAARLVFFSSRHAPCHRP